MAKSTEIRIKHIEKGSVPDHIMVKWDRGWYDGNLRQEGWIDVDQAIELRPPGSTKVGDLYCCGCKKQRIGPVDSTARVRHFRQNRASPTEKKKRETSCKRIKRSEMLDETWKHTRVVDAILAYLNNDGKDLHKVDSVEEAGGVNRDEPDLVVKHTEQLSNFESTTTHILVRFKNFRRQREVMKKLNECIVLEAHRWTSDDVNDDNFLNAIRKKVDQAYDMTPTNRANVGVQGHETKFPNFGYWDDTLSGHDRQRVIKIKELIVTADGLRQAQPPPEEIQDMLKQMEGLVSAIDAHNMWAITNKGTHQYHLKYLSFEPFEGAGTHPDSGIDAMIAHVQQSLPGENSATIVLSVRGVPTEVDIVSARGMLAIDVPDILIWDELTDDEKKSAIRKTREQYYKQFVCIPKFGLFQPTPLVEIKWGEMPKELVDKNDIATYLSGHDYDQDIDYHPLRPEEFALLKYLVSAEKWLGSNVRPHHPFFQSILHERKYSSEHYDNKTLLPIPPYIYQKVMDEYGRDLTETEWMDIIERGVLSKHEEE